MMILNYKNAIYDIINLCIIKKISNIYFFPHKNPDADAMGACASLSKFFNQIGFYSKIIIKNKYENDDFYHEDLTNYIGSENFIAVLCDCSHESYLENDIWKQSNYFIKIDHHISNENNNYIKEYININASSTCEIITEMFMENDLYIDNEIANWLYYGILTDTGRFNYAINNNITFNCLSWLIKNGANIVEMHELYNNKKLINLEIEGYILKNINLYKYKKNTKEKVAFCEINQETIKIFNTNPKNFTKEINLLGNIENVNIWCLIVEIKPNVFTISLRSSEKTNINVEEIVKNYNGGGHFHSAGCILNKNEKNNFINVLMKK